jgi:hypothetical protein
MFGAHYAVRLGSSADIDLPECSWGDQPGTHNLRDAAQLRQRCQDLEALVEDLQRRALDAEAKLCNLHSQVHRYLGLADMHRVMASVGAAARALNILTSTMSPEWGVGPAVSRVAAACSQVLSSCKAAIRLQDNLRAAVAQFAPVMNNDENS